MFICIFEKTCQYTPFSSRHWEEEHNSLLGETFPGRSECHVHHRVIVYSENRTGVNSIIVTPCFTTSLDLREENNSAVIIFGKCF